MSFTTHLSQVCTSIPQVNFLAAMPSGSWAGAPIMAPITGLLQTPGMSTGETKVRWNVFSPLIFVPNFVL